jgi:putative ABC transport system permease protein
VLGLILSFPFTSAVTRILGLYLLKFPLKPAYSWSGILAWLLLIIVLSALANFLPARNASRLTVREVLAYE